MFKLSPPQGNSVCNKRQTGLISSKYETPGSWGRTGHAGLSPRSISSFTVWLDRGGECSSEKNCFRLGDSD